MNHDKGQHFYLSSGLMIIHRVGRSFRSLFLRVQPSYSRWYQICAGNGYSVFRSLTADRTGSRFADAGPVPVGLAGRASVYDSIYDAISIRDLRIGPTELVRRYHTTPCQKVSSSREKTCLYVSVGLWKLTSFLAKSMSN